MNKAPAGLRIAVIDDEVQMTKLLKSLLEDELKVSVETFNDPLEAFKCLQKKNFDVISLDHRMPQMTGAALLELLRSSEGPNKKTPVLMFTGFLEEVMQLGVEKLEHVLLLEKPISDEKYLRNIQFAIEMKKQLKQKKKAA